MRTFLDAYWRCEMEKEVRDFFPRQHLLPLLLPPPVQIKFLRSELLPRAGGGLGGAMI